MRAEAQCADRQRARVLTAVVLIRAADLARDRCAVEAVNGARLLPVFLAEYRRHCAGQQSFVVGVGHFACPVCRLVDHPVLTLVTLGVRARDLLSQAVLQRPDGQLGEARLDATVDVRSFRVHLPATAAANMPAISSWRQHVTVYSQDNKITLQHSVLFCVVLIRLARITRQLDWNNSECGGVLVGPIACRPVHCAWAT